MSLHDPGFEKAMRHRVKAALRASPALQREYKRVRQTSQRDVSQTVLRLLLSAGLYVALQNLAKPPGNLDSLLALLTIWCTTFAIHLANRLRFELYAAPPIVVLALQPIPDHAIFNHQWRGFARRSLWILADAAIGLAVIFHHAQAGPAQWLAAPPCALAIWMSAVAVATSFVAVRPAANYGLLASGLFLVVFFVVVAAFYRPDAVARALHGASGPFYLLPPFGWLNYTIRTSVLGPELLPLALLLPIGLLAPALHQARRRLIEEYQLFASDPAALENTPSAGIQEPEGNLSAAADLDELLAQVKNPAPKAAADPEFIEHIHAVWARPEPGWSERRAGAGWIERRIAAWLTPRERTVAEYLTAGQAGWSLLARRAAILAFAAVLAGFTLGPTGLWIAYFGLYFAASTALPILGSGCPGFTDVQLAGSTIPAYALFPISHQDISRFLLKVGVIRTAAFAPVGLAAGALLGHVAGISWPAGLLIAAKLVIVAFAWQPLAVTFQISAGTNDTRSSTRRALKVLLALGPCIVIAVGTAIGSLFTPLPWAVACLAATTLASGAGFILYRRLYRGRTFDLMHGQAQ